MPFLLECWNQRVSLHGGDQRPTMLAKQTEAEKATYFLNNIINKDIEIYFIRLLNEMEKFGGVVKQLAQDILKIGIWSCAYVYVCLCVCACVCVSARLYSRWK